MPKKQFLVSGNICGNRIKVARVIHNPSLSQKELARIIQLEGMDMTPLIISRIEANQRHVCDAELRMISKVLGVSMEWLCGEGNSIEI